MSKSIVLYQQLADSLRDKIYEGKYVMGDKLPSERGLADKFGISHLTVRKALKLLEEEGLLMRVQGKGTFVRAPKATVNMRHPEGFSGLFDRQENIVVNRVLYSGTRPAKFKFSHIFDIDSTDEVFECVRLRLENDIPLAIEYNVVPIKYAPDISSYDYEICSVRDVYEQKGVKIKEERQMLEIVQIYNPQADLLGLEEGADIFMLSALSCDDQGNVIEWTKIYDNDTRIVFYASTL